LEAARKGTVNAEACLEKTLLPTSDDGDIFVLDKLSAGKSARLSEILARKTSTFGNPPTHSPDINPIEMAFS
jgi:hypothetical protein